jgi:transcriptional regulator with XRE-family HTH domain
MQQSSHSLPAVGHDALPVTEIFRIELGKRIREERERRGYPNAKDFARALGIDASQLSRLEHGLRRIDSVLLRRIADVLDVRLEILMPRSEGAVALARRGEAGDGEMQTMVDWALELRTDIDAVSRYVGRPLR